MRETGIISRKRGVSGLQLCRVSPDTDRAGPAAASVADRLARPSLHQHHPAHLPKSREQPLLPFLPGSRSEPPPPPFVSRQAEPSRRTWDVFAHGGGVAQCLSAAVQAAKAVLAVIRPGLLRLGRFKSRCDLKFLCLHMYMALSGKGLLSEGQRPWADCEGLAAYFIRADPPFSPKDKQDPYLLIRNFA